MANTFTERIKLILTGAKKAAKDAKRFETGLKGIQRQALTAGAAFFGTQGIIQGIKQSVELSTRFEEVQRGFMKLGAGVNMSHTSIVKLRSAVNGTVNDVDLMRLANNALMLGVASSSEEMEKLFDGAQRLGAALGKDVKQSIESLVTGMGRQSRLMLDNLGIIVDSGIANDRYAEKMGITGRALDENERKLAFNEEATRQLTSAVEKLGDEQVTAAMRLQQLGADWDNFLKQVGDGFTPFTNTLIDLTGWMKDSGIVTDDLATAIGDRGLTGTYDEAKLALAEYMQGLKDHHDVTTDLASSQDLMKMNTMQFIAQFAVFRDELVDTGRTAIGFNREIMVDALPALSIYAMEYLNFIDEKIIADKKAIISSLALFQIPQSAFLGADPTGGADPTDSSFATFVEQQEKALALREEEQVYIDKFIEKYPIEAEMLGLLNSEKLLELELKKAIADQDALDKENEADRVAGIQKEIDILGNKNKMYTESFSAAEQLLGLNKKNAKAVADMQALQAISDAWFASQISFKQAQQNPATIPNPAYPYIIAGATLAKGLATAAQVRATARAEEGMDTVVTEPTLILAGEAGPEYVDIEPTTNEGANRGGGTVIFQGNILSDDFIVGEAIPKIRKALQRGESLGIE